jgi:hypothetical protein
MTTDERPLIPAKYRKLRIAWSGAWGLLSVVVIAWWLRSYFVWDLLEFKNGSSFYSAFGQYRLVLYEGESVEQWRYHAGGIGSWSSAHRYLADFYVASLSWLLEVRFPHWFAALSLAFVAGVTWIRWRFSLRTLLLAISLVAAVLGLVVWAVSK